MSLLPAYFVFTRLGKAIFRVWKFVLSTYYYHRRSRSLRHMVGTCTLFCEREHDADSFDATANSFGAATCRNADRATARASDHAAFRTSGCATACTACPDAQVEAARSPLQTVDCGLPPLTGP